MTDGVTVENGVAYANHDGVELARRPLSAASRQISAETCQRIAGAGRRAWRRLGRRRAQRLSILGSAISPRAASRYLPSPIGSRPNPRRSPKRCRTCLPACNSSAARPRLRHRSGADRIAWRFGRRTSRRACRAQRQEIRRRLSAGPVRRDRHQRQSLDRRLRRLRSLRDVVLASGARRPQQRQQGREIHRCAADGEPAALFRCLADQLRDLRQQRHRRAARHRHRGRSRRPQNPDRAVPTRAQAGRLFRAALHRARRAALLDERSDRGAASAFPVFWRRGSCAFSPSDCERRPRPRPLTFFSNNSVPSFRTSGWIAAATLAKSQGRNTCRSTRSSATSIVPLATCPSARTRNCKRSPVQISSSTAKICP